MFGNHMFYALYGELMHGIDCRALTELETQIFDHVLNLTLHSTLSCYPYSKLKHVRTHGKSIGRKVTNEVIIQSDPVLFLLKFSLLMVIMPY